MARIHEQFEQTLLLSVPTLHIKVVSVVDVNSTIAKIKELRASRPESSVDEDELWDEIKVNTFALHPQRNPQDPAPYHRWLKLCLPADHQRRLKREEGH